MVTQFEVPGEQTTTVANAKLKSGLELLATTAGPASTTNGATLLPEVTMVLPPVTTFHQ